jgi:hypothetical protein
VALVSRDESTEDGRFISLGRVNGVGSLWKLRANLCAARVILGRQVLPDDERGDAYGRQPEHIYTWLESFMEMAETRSQ